MRVRIVRTPAGNFSRLGDALRRAGAEPELVRPADLAPDGRPIVLAGVSSFPTIARALAPARSTLRAEVRAGTPVLGVCAGFQVLFDASDEGSGVGVGVRRGRVRRLHSSRVPNLGWCRLLASDESRMLDGVPSGSFAYFAHSYRVPGRMAGVVARTVHSGEAFPSAVEDRALWGMQFHPELSGRVGARMLANFVEHCREGRR